MSNNEKSKSILEIVLMPLVIAAVGAIGTMYITQAQLNSTERIAVMQRAQAMEQSDSSRQLKLIEIFGDKITSSNIEDKKLAIGLLRLIDPTLGENLTKLVLEEQKAAPEIREFARDELQRRIQLSADASPPTVASGDTTIISVMVRDASGAPLPGANVIISAGGGKFLQGTEQYDRSSRLQGPYSASGISDGAGRFSSRWVCNPCASGYGMSVDASKLNYVNGKTELTVNIR